jgi:N-methylhydantoinase A/oxoprolinase/acetone carboxylase beta subunit
MYDMADVLPEVTVTVPAAIVSPFTTIILAPAETARVTADGDVVIAIEA